MKRLSSESRAEALILLNEGISVRSTSGATGTARHKILNLIAEAGQLASVYQGEPVGTHSGQRRASGRGAPGLPACCMPCRPNLSGPE